MSKPLKVLMMGGRRTGKSSMLAALLDQLINGQLSSSLTIANKDTLDASRLNSKIDVLKKQISDYSGRLIMVDDEITSKFDDYTITLKIPNTSETMDILFTDLNGEFFESGMEGAAETQKKIKEYDVFLIAIDTPYLMEAVNPKNKLCTEAINLAYNFVEDIHDFLTYIDDKDGNDAKQVIFVPLKCEYWAKHNRLEEVYQRVLKVYDTPITALKKYNNIEIDIIPIQTAGALMFEEHRESAILVSPSFKKPLKCAYDEDKDTVRFYDGYERPVAHNEIIDDDPEGVVSEKYPIPRPYTWFKVQGDYNPRNSEQLVLYILMFLVRKLLVLQQIEQEQKKRKAEKRRWWNYLGIAVLAWFSWPAALGVVVYNLYKSQIGTMKIKSLNDMLTTVTTKHILKKDTEGIHMIKKSAFDEVKL